MLEFWEKGKTLKNEKKFCPTPDEIQLIGNPNKQIFEDINKILAENNQKPIKKISSNLESLVYSNSPKLTLDSKIILEYNASLIANLTLKNKHFQNI